MRDLTWQMFELTGDIDAYLLYRGACNGLSEESEVTSSDDNISNETDTVHPQ
ncbi:YqzL family protein [Alicyclobacillus dauci]|uniref:YqzL family protein n=1 Tax=Alicyclobacillus dauci TaxID=1475485 RepID=A0ABY6Z6U9_9BACL|nr:YqzL family protein [Alicyclobacillus dauci]WAH38552.1 YqzL family protein [Alicyclobacillus dauci]